MTEESEALARIEERLKSHIETEASFQTRIHIKLDAIDAALRGNGAGPGLMTRVDRLEQREAGRSKLLWVTVTAAVGALVAWVKAAVTK